MRRTNLTVLLVGLNMVLLLVVCWQAHVLRQRPGGQPAMPAAGGEAAAVAPSSSSGPPGGLHVSAVEGGPVAAAEGGSRALEAVQARLPSSPTNQHPWNWRQVESDDYRTYVQNLRKIGCPEQTIRDIVSADILQALGARRAEALAAFYRDFQYWKADPTQTAARAQLGAQRKAVDEEMASLLHELLGSQFVPPPTDHEWRAAELDQQLEFLPADKREKAKSLLLQYAGTDQQVRSLANNEMLTENAEERRGIIEAYDRKQAALAQLLTPVELEQVELTTSWTAENLRRATVHFQPTEEEFRSIFREWFAQDEKLARMRALGEPDPGNLEEQVFARIKESRGAKRYQEYRSTWWK